ncbi:MAG TPA: hypothetical protein ENK66_09140 [Arcobacter sp.]|nr:hypothetical protein [Arcobacter sp.]
MEIILFKDVQKMKVLILSDGRIGHLNQSIALARYLRLSYEIVEVRFKNQLCQVLSYIFDRIGLKSRLLFEADIINQYKMVIGTGSRTYYATKVISKKMNIKSVVMMFPRGYRLDYDTIFVQSHDNPPKKKNIIEIPANFSYVDPKGIYRAKKKSIGIVIGGDNKMFKMSVVTLKEQLDFIKEFYHEYEIAITTSPRTEKEVENLVKTYHFNYEVVFSRNPINPIPDFLEQCESIFITGDSTSMISEAISYGNCNVIVLPLKSKEDNKFMKFIVTLARGGYLHIFDGTIEQKNKKIDFMQYIPKATL